MACIGFDLDETLGRFVVPYYHLVALQPQQSLYNEFFSGKYGTQQIEPPGPYTDSLKAKCDKAFDIFCECIANEERKQLGLIRPGIVDVAKRLYELKQTTPPMVQSVIIYSNNGNMASLRLAARVIEILADTPGLFCNMIHWFHPSREDEVQIGNPGSARKTLETLLEGFESGGCPREEIDINNVYFFDDLVHANIAHVIGDRYFHVPAYKFDADPLIIDECFLTAFKAVDLEHDAEYWNYIRPLGVENEEELIKFIKQNHVPILKKNRPNNSTIRNKFQKRFPPAAKGGKRNRKTRRWSKRC